MSLSLNNPFSKASAFALAGLLSIAPSFASRANGQQAGVVASMGKSAGTPNSVSIPVAKTNFAPIKFSNTPDSDALNYAIGSDKDKVGVTVYVNPKLQSYLQSASDKLSLEFYNQDIKKVQLFAIVDERVPGISFSFSTRNGGFIDETQIPKKDTFGLEVLKSNTIVLLVSDDAKLDCAGTGVKPVTIEERGFSTLSCRR